MIARWFGLVVGMIALSNVVGCWSDDGLPQRYPVNGMVKLKGQPLVKGLINFIPEKSDEGRGASATIRDGNYTLTTSSPDDGAFPGKYNITVSDVQVDMGVLKDNMRKGMAKGKSTVQMSEGTIDEAMLGKMSKKAKNTVPTKYSLPTTSQLKAEVKEGSNTLNFDLTD